MEGTQGPFHTTVAATPHPPSFPVLPRNVDLQAQTHCSEAQLRTQQPWEENGHYSFLSPCSVQCTYKLPAKHSFLSR